MLYPTLVLVFLELLGPLQEATVDYRAATGLPVVSVRARKQSLYKPPCKAHILKDFRRLGYCYVLEKLDMGTRDGYQKTGIIQRGTLLPGMRADKREP